MNDEINLLIRSQTVETPLLKRLKTLRLVAIGFLSLTTVIAIVLFLLTTLSPLQKLKEEEAAQNAQLDQMKSKMAKLFLVKERTTALTELIDDRKEFDVIITNLREQLPEGAEISELKTDKSVVEFSVISESLDDMENILAKMAALSDEQKKYSIVVLKDLMLSEESKYTAKIYMQYI
jgi:Tfp pilus assembly protein PilN